MIKIQNLVEEAEKVARKAHEGQFRKDGVTPYITHPEAVANALASDGYNDECIAVAWLHDVVEDTKVTLQDLRDIGFPYEIVNAVDCLTRRPGQNIMYYLGIIRRTYLAITVKLYDIHHNMSCFKKQEGSLWDKYQLCLWYLKR